MLHKNALTRQLNELTIMKTVTTALFYASDLQKMLKEKQAADAAAAAAAAADPKKAETSAHAAAGAPPEDPDHARLMSSTSPCVCQFSCRGTTGYLSFHPMAQCVVHVLKGLARRARVSLRLARLPSTASSAQRSHCLRSACAAASVLLAQADVTKNIISFPVGPELR